MGSLPFDDIGEALEWQRSLSLRIQCRPQLPKLGANFDIIGEVENPCPWMSCLGTFQDAKDQLCGPWTYREAAFRRGESPESALERLEHRMRAHLEALHSVPGVKLFLFDDPALLLADSFHDAPRAPELFGRFIRLVNSFGIEAGIHCCQRVLSNVCSDLLRVLPVSVVSLPLTEGNRHALLGCYRAGKTVCLGVQPGLLADDAAAFHALFRSLCRDAELSEEQMASRTLISPECGFAGVEVSVAEQTINGLFQLRDSFFAPLTFRSMIR